MQIEQRVSAKKDSTEVRFGGMQVCGLVRESEGGGATTKGSPSAWIQCVCVCLPEKRGTTQNGFGKRSNNGVLAAMCRGQLRRVQAKIMVRITA